MPRQLNKEQAKRRNALIRKWLEAGITVTEIQNRVKDKYGIGVHSYTVAAIRENLDMPAPRKSKTTALVLSSSTGLVPAKELSPRLRALITHVADAMTEEGVLTVSIDGRQVNITHVPEELSFEV